MSRHLSSLRSRLIMLVFMIIITLFVLEIIMEFFWFRSRYLAETENELDVANSIGVAFQAFIRDIQRTEYLIGVALQKLKLFKQEDIQVYYHLINKSYPTVTDIFVIDSTGNIIAGSNSLLIGINVSDQKHVIRLMQGDTNVLSDFLHIMPDSTDGFVVANGFYKLCGSLDFAVMATIQANKLGDITLRFKRQIGEYITLFDKQGTLIYTNQQLNIDSVRHKWKKYDRLLKKALNGEIAMGFFTVPVEQNNNRIGAYVLIPKIEWISGAAISRTTFFQPLIQFFLVSISILISVAGIAFLIAEQTVHAISDSLSIVQKHVKQVSHGEFDTIKADSGFREFDALTNDVNIMAQQLKDREERLRLLAAVVENSSNFMLMASPSMKPFYINEAGIYMVGINRSELNKTPLEDFLAPKDRELFEKITKPALLKEEHWKGELSLRNFNTGESIPTIWSAFAIKNESGKIIAWATICPDLTELKKTSEALAQSERRFRELANSMPQLVWTANPDGTIDYYNERYRDFGGIVPKENSWIWTSGVHSDDLQYTKNTWIHSIQTGQVYQMEHRIKHADGTYHWYLSRGIPIRDDNGKIVKWYATTTNIDSTKKAQLALVESENQLKNLNQDLEKIVVSRTEQVRTLSKALILAEQRERKRFSYTLHENLQQLILGAKILLNQHLREHIGKVKEEMINDLVEGISMLDRALKTTRALSIELNPPVLQSQGLDSILKWLLSHMRKNYELTVELRIKGPIDTIKNELQLMLTQMVRELLNNVVQHSGVLEASVELVYENNKIFVTVCDQGRGFNPKKISKTHLGLFSIRERLKLFSGDLEINSALDKGTCVKITLPIESLS